MLFPTTDTEEDTTFLGGATSAKGLGALLHPTHPRVGLESFESIGG